MRDHYTAILDAIGYYVEAQRGGDALVQEIEGGFLVSYVRGDEQVAVTFEPADVVRLNADAQAETLHDPNGVRTLLRAIGRYFDRRVATAVMVQELSEVCLVEYSARMDEHDELSGLGRLYETLDRRQCLDSENALYEAAQAEAMAATQVGQPGLWTRLFGGQGS